MSFNKLFQKAKYVFKEIPIAPISYSFTGTLIIEIISYFVSMIVMPTENYRKLAIFINLARIYLDVTQ